MLGSGVKISQEEDPTLICCAFKKSRFYLFTRREPEEPEGDQETGETGAWCAWLSEEPH
jgi:hypothetical protein